MPTNIWFVHPDEPDGDDRVARKKGRDWALRRAELRKREQWLDECSDPPDESLLYGETLVIDGEPVGDWRFIPPPFEMDTKAVLYTSTYIAPPAEEAREVFLAQERRDAEREERYKREEPLREARILAKHLRQRLRNHKTWIKKREYGRQYRERKRQETETRPPTAPVVWRSPPPSQRPRPIPLPASRPEPITARERGPVRLTDAHGIEHVIPLDVYERLGRDALPLGVDPPVWVLYRLGFGWNE
jgi:hypothetical protein